MKVVHSIGITLVLMLFLASSAEARRKWKFNGDTEDFEFEEETQAQRRPKGARTGATGSNQHVHQSTQDTYDGSNGRYPKSKTSEDSELCLALRCSPDEYCLVKNENVALCAPLKKPSSKDRKLLPTHSKMSKVAADEEEDQEDEEDDDDDEDEDEEDNNSSGSDDSSEYDDESTEGLLKQSTCAPCQVAKPTFVCGSDNKTYSSPCRIQYHNCVHRSNVKMACNGFCPCSDSKAKHGQKQKQMSQRWNNFVNKYKMTMSQPNNNNNKGNNNSNNGDSSSTKTPSAAQNDYITGQKPMKSDSSQFQPKYKNMGTKTGKNQSKVIGNPPFAEDKQRQKGHNSVLSEKVPLPGTNGEKSECNAHDLEVMENRLLDWFSVVMSESKKNKSRRRSRGFGVTFPSRCQQEVQWIFVHLDSDVDGRLGLKELHDLEQDAHEHCIKPFLEHCDSNQDVLLTPAEWCACFDQSERPCLSAKSRSRSGLLGSYLPSCDEDGYYKSTQCHDSVGLCWCVDKHGVEYANTRTRGKPDCDTIIGNSRSSIEDTEDEDDEDSMIEGSADQPLDI